MLAFLQAKILESLVMSNKIVLVNVSSKSPMFFGTEDEERQRNLDLATALNDLEKEGLVVVDLVAEESARNTRWLVFCRAAETAHPFGEIEVHEFKIGFDRPVTYGSLKEAAVLHRKMEELLDGLEGKGLLRLALVPLDNSHQHTWLAICRREIKD